MIDLVEVPEGEILEEIGQDLILEEGQIEETQGVEVYIIKDQIQEVEVLTEESQVPEDTIETQGVQVDIQEGGVHIAEDPKEEVMGEVRVEVHTEGVRVEILEVMAKIGQVEAMEKVHIAENQVLEEIEVEVHIIKDQIQEILEEARMEKDQVDQVRTVKSQVLEDLQTEEEIILEGQEDRIF